ncbi:hypothetical protein ExPCM14_00075 [Escherichia coli]|nr:hypothetical protein ExPCM14_00075 [Escherichia coli]
MLQRFFLPAHFAVEGDFLTLHPAICARVHHLREQFGLHIHGERQRAILPVAGDEAVQRLFHLFQAGHPVLRLPVQAGNTLCHCRVNPAAAGQHTQESTRMW